MDLDVSEIQKDFKTTNGQNEQMCEGIYMLGDEPPEIFAEPKKEKPPVGNKFDVEKFIVKNNLSVIAVHDFNDKKLWQICCPFEQHEDKTAFIQQYNNGVIGAGCHYEGCDWDWKELRVKFDPKYAHRQELKNEAAEMLLPEFLETYKNLLAAKKDNMCIDNDGHILILQGSGEKCYWAILSNFVPIPFELISEIDGVDDDVTQVSVKIGGYLEGRELNPIVINQTDLFNNKWFIDLDFKANINSDIRGGCDKIREVIQIFSEKAVKRSVYTHLGFRTIDDKLCYLHANGAVGLENVSTNLHKNNLSGYELEDISGMSDEEKLLCIKQSLKVFDIHKYGNVLFSYTFLSPLCYLFDRINNMPSFSMWIHGRSGTYKTTIACLLLGFFGKNFSKTNLPMSYNDTENTLTKKLALCKDSLAIIDDILHPTANNGDLNKQKRLAQDMMFNIANRTGRGRMKQDQSLRKTLVPEGMVIFTAEYPFDNVSESTTARLLSVELERDSVNLDVLTDCQNNTANLNKTMACYIDWLICNYDRLTTDLQQRFENLRSEFMKELGTDTNTKLAEVEAFMLVSMEHVLEYFVEIGAMDNDYKTNALNQLNADLQALIIKQSQSILENSPTKMFMAVIPNLITEGTIYTKDLSQGLGDSNGKNFAGWHDKENYYFLVGEDTGRVYVASKDYYKQHGTDFTIKPKELWKLLVCEGIVTETDKPDDSGTPRHTKTKSIAKKSYKVLVIPKKCFDVGESTDEDLTKDYDDTVYADP